MIILNVGKPCALALLSSNLRHPLRGAFCRKLIRCSNILYLQVVVQDNTTKGWINRKIRKR